MLQLLILIAQRRVFDVVLEQLDSPAATSDWLQKVKQGAAIEISTEAFSEIDTRSDTLLKNSSSWTVFLDLSLIHI